MDVKSFEDRNSDADRFTRTMRDDEVSMFDQNLATVSELVAADNAVTEEAQAIRDGDITIEQAEAEIVGKEMAAMQRVDAAEEAFAPRSAELFCDPEDDEDDDQYNR